MALLVITNAATGFPSTNNSLEATNSVIKKEFTLGERLPLDKFIKTAGLIIKRWSQEGNHADPSAKVMIYNFIIIWNLTFHYFQKFQETPETSVLLQKEAYSLSKSDIEVREKTINGNKFCFIPSTSSSHKPIREEEITNYFKKTENPKFRTFENYINFTTRMWVVNYNEEWQTSTCTCLTFLKTFICKHILAIAIINKNFIVSPLAKPATNDLSKKRQRGRPRKATKALIVD